MKSKHQKSTHHYIKQEVRLANELTWLTRFGKTGDATESEIITLNTTYLRRWHQALQETLKEFQMRTSIDEHIQYER